VGLLVLTLAYKLLKWKYLLQQKWATEKIDKRVYSYAKLQQIHLQDLLFADFIIADITSGLKICLFAEIAPCTIYPLYDIQYY